MQYGIIYRMEFKNTEDFTVRIDISPTDILIDDGDTPQTIELKGGATPLIISASNNDEDKYTPIRSKSAEITFRSDTGSGLDSGTFSQGADDLWIVNIYLQDTPELIFSGYLMMADNQQPFQPDPQYITLTATDHLAALKEVPLVDFDDINPVGKYMVADLVAMCLRKTGLSKQIYVVNNLRAGGGQITVDDVATSFTSSPNQFITGATRASFFYPGQSITISGTVSNNGVFTVTAVGTGIVTIVQVAEALVNEASVANVVFTDNVSASHWYDVVYLDAKTFEKAIGESEDCYSVLSKILGEDCYITQWKGDWWIMRVDEFEDNPIYVAEFNPDGTYVSTAAGTTYNYNIGEADDSKFANADTLLRFVRPHGFIKETFNFVSPLEVPCNINFSRGDLSATISTTEKQYDLDCWTKRRGLPGAYNVPITITVFITRYFNANSYEIERFIFITPQTGHAGFSSTDDEYIESEAIPVLVGDKAETSIQWRLDADIASSSAELRLFRIILAGDDGSYWILGEATVGDGIPVWYDTAGWTLFTGKGATGVVFGDQDETEWQSIDWSVPPMPVSGNLYIWLNQAYTNAAVPSTAIINYSNLRFDYIPLINGTYSIVTGQYSKVTRTEDGYLANRDNQVFISDSPTKIYKGAMYLLVNGAYILVGNWFAAAPFGNSYPPNQDYLHPYGYIQAFSVWNQYKGYNDPTTGRGKGINIFSGSLKGLTDSWPDMLHKYILTDTNSQTNNRYFMLLSLEQDWKTCIWTGTFIEVYNTVIYKTYDDDFEFKYLTE